MDAASPEDTSPLAVRRQTAGCPPWCVVIHGAVLGEEDWIHEGAAVALGEGIDARLCMSVDPVQGAVDGPYVLVACAEYTLAEARDLGISIIALADAVAGSPEAE
jgi:hypothetical protein